MRRSGSVSAAATLLDLSQPDVSRALTKLAAAVGRASFKRTRTGMTATSDAIILSDLRSKLLAEMTPLRDQLEALAQEITGRVSVGLLPFSEQEVVARVFGRMLKPYRHVRLQAVTGSYAALTDALRRGELDIVLGPLRRPAPFADVEELHLLDEAFTVVARAGHPLAQYRATLKDLAKENWVVAPHGTPTRMYFEKVLVAEGLTPPSHTCEIVTFFLAEQVLLHSDAIGLLTYSERKAKSLREGLTIIPVDLPDRLRQIGATLRKEPHLTSAQNIFMNLLIEEIGVSSLTVK